MTRPLDWAERAAGERDESVNDELNARKSSPAFRQVRPRRRQQRAGGDVHEVRSVDLLLASDDEVRDGLTRSREQLQQFVQTKPEETASAN
jgi:hypothetical protein